MASDRNPVCFTCGQPTGDDVAVNRLPSGEACPTCRDRLLDGLPPLLPSAGDAELEIAVDDDDDDPIGA